MTLLEQLQENKGTVYSALGKELAKAVLNGNRQLLQEAVELIHYETKNVRSGAAKIVEKVAESKPEWVAEYMPDLLGAMNYPEPQTRWMVLHIGGLCATYNPEPAKDLLHTCAPVTRFKTRYCSE